MNRCEHFETLVSSWLDGALGRAEQVECVDHLVRCGSCRRFYSDARALDGLVAALRRPAAAAQPSPATWPRIASATARRKPPVWMLQAAALVTLALSLYLAVGTTGRGIPGPVGTERASADVVLGVGGNMTDTRFVELTKEVLRAEPRYRAAMHDVLIQVMRDATSSEMPAGEFAAPALEGPREEPESDRRLPA